MNPVTMELLVTLYKNILGYHVVRQVQLFLKVAVNVRGHYIGTHLPEINIT